jgi:predicted RNase H-like HicB family nuclease
MGSVDRRPGPGQFAGVKKKPAKVEETAAAYAAKRSTRSAKTRRELTAIIQREDDGFVALCPELDVASQGDTRKEARANLVEAVTLFLEVASPAEVATRLRSDTRITKLEIAIG